MKWRYLNAAARGTSHERAGLPCQDDCLAEVIELDGEEVLLAIAADGAGSASHAEEGSGLACEMVVAAADAWLRGGGTIDTLDRETVDHWISDARTAIDERAAARQLTAREFACTLVMAIAGVNAAAFIQIGDGAIVTVCGDAADVVFWPDGGEYANMTYFLTDADWAKHVHFDVRHASFDCIGVMTDGLQRLALQFQTRSAHMPFFEPMFQAMERCAAGLATELEGDLLTFLGSDAVNARTDDDKSLVLATRRAGAASNAG